MGGAQAQLPPDSWTPSGEMAYTGPVFVPNGAENVSCVECCLLVGVFPTFEASISVSSTSFAWPISGGREE